MCANFLWDEKLRLLLSCFLPSPEVKHTRCVCCCVTLLHTCFLLWRVSATPAAQQTTLLKSSEMWVFNDIKHLHDSFNCGVILICCLWDQILVFHCNLFSYFLERNSLLCGGSSETACFKSFVWAGDSSGRGGWSPSRLQSGPLPHGSSERHLPSWWETLFNT